MPLQLVNYPSPVVLAAALYNQFRVTYPGNSVFDPNTNLTTTWLPSSTFPTQPDKAYLILPVRPLSICAELHRCLTYLNPHKAYLILPVFPHCLWRHAQASSKHVTAMVGLFPTIWMECCLK